LAEARRFVVARRFIEPEEAETTLFAKGRYVYRAREDPCKSEQRETSRILNSKPRLRLLKPLEIGAASIRIKRLLQILWS
jgi:hypothetical protein